MNKNIDHDAFDSERKFLNIKFILSLLFEYQAWFFFSWDKLSYVEVIKVTLKRSCQEQDKLGDKVSD